MPATRPRTPDRATLIVDMIERHFDQYQQAFRTIALRGWHRFMQAEWLDIQADSKERLALYRLHVQEAADMVGEMLGAQAQDRLRWGEIRTRYAERMTARMDYEIGETFYNSVCRKVFGNAAADNTTMFVTSGVAPRLLRSELLIYREYELRPHRLREVIKLILLDYGFDVPFRDLDRDVSHIVRSVRADLPQFHQNPPRRIRLQVMKSVFFRNKAAYLIGRAYVDDEMVPLVVPIMHQEGRGLTVDTIIFDPGQIGTIFSYTRSYFLVKVNIPSEFVAFLKTLMPHKKVSEIYNSIGYNKHGKTELYRDMRQHLRTTTDQFVLAPGIKGMVMSVFLLPSYNIVFKLIKDHFDPPKSSTRQEVKDKYKLVSDHDRVGRMADTHEFENLVFQRDRFDPQLLDELRRVAPSLIAEDGEKVVIRHLYTERRMEPLNLYLAEATPAEAEEAIIEYGNAIKQLAAANIFPGDMLLKNFGVTRHRRVIFYDYDEIVFLTECNFRRIPEPRNMQELYSSEPWYSVAENDVFPEQFVNFLVGGELRKIFERVHGDLFDVVFWQETQARIRRGEVIHAYPYSDQQRFVHRWARRKATPISNE